jgi:ADP-ribose pyrophosphatase YjhB (NUDIX family)
MKREYPKRPIVAVAGVIFHDRSVLIVKRDKEPAKGQWSLPGGAVKVGETLIEALKREIYEEVSIEIEIRGFVGLIDRIIYDQERRVRFHYVIADYWGYKVSGNPKPGSDISDAHFVHVNRVRSMGMHREVEETVLMAERLKNQHARGCASFDQM